MNANELAEHAKRTWGEQDADAADRFIELTSKSTAVQKTVSDVPETPLPDGQSAW